MFDAEFAKLPTDAPRDPRLLPGLRLASAMPKWLIFLPLLFGAFFAFAALSIVATDPAVRLAMGPTVAVAGRITAVGNTMACRGLAARRIAYAFTVQSEYRGSATVCEASPYYAASVGDAITIDYLRGNPSISTVSGDSRNAAPPFAVFLFMPVFLLVFVGALCWPPVRDLLSARRLFKSGQMTLGTVVFVKKRAAINWPNMPGSTSTEVFVQFHTRDGRAAEAIAACRNDWLVNLLTPGTQVHIAYANDDLKSVALLDGFIR